MIISDGTTQRDSVDISQLYIKLMNEYRNIYIEKIENAVFIYRSIGRAEYRKIMSEKQIDDMQKEEIICETCVLYPENYNFEDCVAGIPTTLCQRIITNSFIDPKAAVGLLVNYRNDMWDLDQQATCIINEAFPQFDIEEIEEWDMEKTMKYLSRAEWKLVNLRNTKIDPDAFIKVAYKDEIEKQESEKKQTVKTEELHGSEKGKERMTPEKLAQLKAQYPDIDWENDDIINNNGVFVPDHVDNTPPALRTDLFI